MLVLSLVLKLEPYVAVAGSHMTEWERARERDEFAKASKIFRPMSAMMSSRFVRGAMIDDEHTQGPSNSSVSVVTMLSLVLLGFILLLSSKANV